jgi:hypothetical protein
MNKSIYICKPGIQIELGLPSRHIWGTTDGAKSNILHGGTRMSRATEMMVCISIV